MRLQPNDIVPVEAYIVWKQFSLEKKLSCSALSETSFVAINVVYIFVIKSRSLLLSIKPNKIKCVFPITRSTDLFAADRLTSFIARVIFCNPSSFKQIFLERSDAREKEEGEQGRTVTLVWFVGVLTSLCHSNGHIETMPAREINPFTALTRIRSQFPWHNDEQSSASGQDYASDRSAIRAGKTIHWKKWTV